MLFNCAFLFAKIYTSETIMYLCFIGKYIMKNNTTTKKEKTTLTKKEYDNLILEFDKSQKIEMTVEDLLATNETWTKRNRNFNINLYKLILNSLTNKQGS
jgi:hypothetical protein